VHAKNQRREHKNVGVIVLPRLARQAGFEAGLLDECVAIPMFFQRDLRQKDSLDIALLHNQSMFTHLDLFNIQDPAQRRHDGDLVLEERQLLGSDGLEARIFQRRIRRHVTHRFRQRFHRRDVADAPPQLAMLLEGDERAAGFLQAREAAGTQHGHLAIAHGGLHRSPRNLHQGILLTAGQGELRALLGVRRTFPRDRHRAITHHAGLVAGGVAGVGVLQNLRVGCAQTLGGDHGRDDGASTARFPGRNAALPHGKVARQAEIVPIGDGLKRLMVDMVRVVVRVVVREVGTHQDERLGARLGRLRQQRLGQRPPQSAFQVVILVAHNDGHQLEIAQRALEPGQLHFQRVLGILGLFRVASIGDLEGGAQFCQLGAKVLVDRNITQRGRIGVAIVNRGEREINIVRWRYDHHTGVFPSLELGEARCRHRAREHVTGMRADQRHQRPWNLRHSIVRQKTINHLGEFFGVGGVETSRHAGGANFRFGAETGIVRGRKHQSAECEENQNLSMRNLHGITLEATRRRKSQKANVKSTSSLGFAF